MNGMVGELTKHKIILATPHSIVSFYDAGRNYEKPYNIN